MTRRSHDRGALTASIVAIFRALGQPDRAWTIADLADHIDVHIRTVRRLLVALRALGLVQRTHDGGGPGNLAEYQGTYVLQPRVRAVEPRPVTANQIRALRHRLGDSTTTFGARLGVSRRAVESWEQGIRQPSMAVRLMLMQLREQNGAPAARRTPRR